MKQIIFFLSLTFSIAGFGQTIKICVNNSCQKSISTNSNFCSYCGAKQVVSKSFTDSWDGKSYKTVKIDDQVWMADNLAYNAGSGSLAYDNDHSNVTKYGYLYNWETAKKCAPLAGTYQQKQTMINCWIIMEELVIPKQITKHWHLEVKVVLWPCLAVGAAPWFMALLKRMPSFGLPLKNMLLSHGTWAFVSKIRQPMWAASIGVGVFLYVASRTRWFFDYFFNTAWRTKFVSKICKVSQTW